LFKNNHYSYKKCNRTTVEREVAASLESVLPRTELKPFIALNTQDKVGQMHELSNIILGIRIFNKAIEKGGVGLSTFEELYYMMSSGNELDKDVNKFTVELIDLIENYNHFLKISDLWKSKQQLQQNAIDIIECLKEE